MGNEIRRIKTAEEIEKRRKRNVMIGSMLMLLILIISSLGYAFMGRDSENSKSNSKTYYNGDKWAVDAGGAVLLFSHPPENVSDVIVDTNLTLNDYYQRTLYIVSEDNLIGSEISLSLGKYVSRVQNACYGNCTYDYPEKDCNDNLIIHNSSGSGRIYQENNCIFVDGNLMELDAFLYKVFGL